MRIRIFVPPLLLPDEPESTGMRPRSYGPLPETTGGGDRFNLFDRLKAHAPPLKSYLLSKTKVSDGTNALKHQLKSFFAKQCGKAENTGNSLSERLRLQAFWRVAIKEIFGKSSVVLFRCHAFRARKTGSPS